MSPSFSDIKNHNLFKSQILNDIDSSIEFANLKSLNEISLNKSIGNPFGIQIKKKIVMPDTPRQYYYVKKIKSLFPKKNNLKILEIGGGYGV